MKELGLVILTCFFLSLAELTDKNIKVLIGLERNMRRHKAFCSCAQRIIHRVNHWHSFKDLYRRVFQDEHVGRSLRPWEGLLSETYLWGKCLWQRSLLNLGLQIRSVAQSCPTLCNPMNRSTPGLPVHHQLPEFTQTHIHRVGDTIQAISSSAVPFSSCPQSLPASESFPMSQLFAWGGQSRNN